MRHFESSLKLKEEISLDTLAERVCCWCGFPVMEGNRAHYTQGKMSLDLLKDAKQARLGIRIISGERKEELMLDQDSRLLQVSWNCGKDNPSPCQGTWLMNGILKEHLAQDDGEIPISRRPYALDAEQVDSAIDLINGKITHRLPVVYLSACCDKRGWYLDPCGLADQLAGTAIVVYETDCSLSSAMLREGVHNHPCNGTVCIYDPARKQRYSRFSPKELSRWPRNITPVLEDLFAYEEELPHRADYEIFAASAYEQLARSVHDENQRLRRESDEICETFDESLKKDDQTIAELRDENQGLRIQNDGLTVRLSARQGNSLIHYGQEKDFYPGEIDGIVMDSLRSLQDQVPPGSRKADILKDLLQANHQDVDTLDARKQKMKNALKDYRSMADKTRRALIGLGFVIKEDGRHYKLTYYGDPRYVDVVSKTGSDGREGRNIASCIIRHVL